ncbi:DNA polymerase III subunit beta [Candidatus Mycoplasma haematohominis]|uniref:DNA polymerase III subunit beta n=1 Tax=Candidatus Mycoplasma haematohominis TaxID=1494318 RepID=A0A478FPC8_9MOLU|nr:DNA polymerase III subunit beta [Candidatus Mycoplasma haemohominis]GCE63201.1 DNA polymerase III subunit beta [Candidatus Mycoplasma haemohominis]
MYLIIKKTNLKKIKNYLSISSNSIKNTSIFIIAKNKKLTFHLSTEIYYTKLELEENENLTIKKEGEALIEIKTLNSLINSLDLKNDLEIYHPEKNYLQFFSGKYQCNLVLLEFNEFQAEKIEIPSDISPLNISYSLLNNIYSKLKDFCKNSDNSIVSNAILTNIHLNKEENISYIEAWASDSYRTVYGEFDFESSKSFELNISPHILSLILGLFQEYKEIDFYLSNSDEYLICKKEEYTFKTKLNLSPYPEFIKWFNMDKKISFTVNKNDLLAAIDRNLLLTNKEIKTTIYRVDKDKLSIEYKDSEKGHCKETLKINSKSNEKIEFCLNNNLLKSLIKFIESEEIIFNVHDSLKPIVLLSNQKNLKFKQFILPARNV